MDFFKLFYNHDQRLDNLSPDHNSTATDTESTLQDFFSPTPTYSSFYLMGTRLQEEIFGLNELNKFDQLLEKLNSTFDEYTFYSSSGKEPQLSEAIKKISIGSTIIISEKGESDSTFDPVLLETDSNSDATRKNEYLHELLSGGCQVIYKEQARNGYDLHLFSKKNIYPKLFKSFRELVDGSFRFFSINSKRMRSEQHFYFETWRLDRPPHGAEEVFANTILRSKT